MNGTIEGDRPDLTGQVALITGGSRGIGRAISEALAACGAAVAVAARSADQVADTVNTISAARGRAIGVTADISDRKAVTDMVTAIERDLGPVDLLINNAGVIAPLGPIAETDPDEWWRCQEINVRGPLLCSRMVLPTMYTRRRGRIVNVVSMAGIMPIPYLSAYLHSKIALVRFTELLALETREHDVRAFSVSPGTVRTEMVRTLTDSDDGQRWTPWVREQLDKVETPVHRVVSLILTIACGAADSLTGRLLNAREDFKRVIERASEVEQEGLYALRIQTLEGLAAPVWDVEH
jgi:NAD(P)-dependent dehydrogenase (short-subunit alcohol dehydrogenase family)